VYLKPTDTNFITLLFSENGRGFSISFATQRIHGRLKAFDLVPVSITHARLKKESYPAGCYSFCMSVSYVQSVIARPFLLLKGQRRLHSIV
jgi:hypothetical protein